MLEISNIPELNILLRHENILQNLYLLNTMSSPWHLTKNVLNKKTKLKLQTLPSFSYISGHVKRAVEQTYVHTLEARPSAWPHTVSLIKTYQSASRIPAIYILLGN